MAIIHINNIRIAGIAAGVPRNIVKTVSTTDKYDDEAYIESVGVRENVFLMNLLLRIYVKQRQKAYVGFELGKRRH